MHCGCDIPHHPSGRGARSPVASIVLGGEIHRIRETQPLARHREETSTSFLRTQKCRSESDYSDPSRLRGQPCCFKNQHQLGAKPGDAYRPVFRRLQGPRPLFQPLPQRTDAVERTGKWQYFYPWLQLRAELSGIPRVYSRSSYWKKCRKAIFPVGRSRNSDSDRLLNFPFRTGFPLT